jgi:hypothetical protein
MLLMSLSIHNSMLSNLLLSRRGLQSAAGFFNDPGATQTTWSDMAATSRSRPASIFSLRDFMAQYEFQGEDLDWE